MRVGFIDIGRIADDDVELLPGERAKPVALRILTLGIARCSALRAASATASGITSTAVTWQSGRSLASARAMAPVPVPRSRMRHGLSE